MNNSVKFLIIFMSALVIVGAGFSVYFILDEKNTGVPVLSVDAAEIDAGEIPIESGLVKHTYILTNSGDDDLEIFGVRTSCMCTTAFLTTEDGKSPEFGMHATNMFWTGKIAPSEEAELEVIFDPMFHGSEDFGDKVRVITISSNDPKKEKTEVKLSINVTK